MPAPIHGAAEYAVRPISRPLRFMRRSDAPRPVALWHLASFDAPTVAVVWSLSFGWVAGVRLPLWIPALLALAVWAVYVGDRLLDARAAWRDSCFDRLRERHFFHWRHRRILLPLAAAAAGSAAVLALLFLKAATRGQGSILAAASLAYFAHVHSGPRHRPFLSPLLTKELLVGLLFTFGCALPVLGRLPALPRSPCWPIFCPMAYFALLAWLNCHAIDSWESQRNVAGRSPILLQSSLIGLAGLLLAAMVSLGYPHPAILLLAGGLSALLLAWLDCRQSRMSPVALRAAADLALLTPALLIPSLWLAR